MTDLFEHLYLSLTSGQSTLLENHCDKGPIPDQGPMQEGTEPAEDVTVPNPDDSWAMRALKGDDGEILTQKTGVVSSKGLKDFVSELHFIDVYDEAIEPFKDACFAFEKKGKLKQLDHFVNLDIKNALDLLKLTSASEKFTFALEVHKDDLEVIKDIFQDFIKKGEDGQLDVHTVEGQDQFSVMGLEFDVNPTTEQLFAFYKYIQWITKESKSYDETVIAQTKNRGANFATLYHIAQKQLENAFPGDGAEYVGKSYFDVSNPESLMTVSAERFVSYAENTTIKADLKSSVLGDSYYKYQLLNYEDGAGDVVNQNKPVYYTELAELAESNGQVFADAISHFQNNVALCEFGFTHEETAYKVKGFMEPNSGFVEVKIYVGGNEVPIELEFDKKDSRETILSHLPEGAKISETALRLAFLYFREYLVALGMETGSKLVTFDKMIVI